MGRGQAHRPRWRFAGGVALVLVAVSFLTRTGVVGPHRRVRGGGPRRLRRRRVCLRAGGHAAHRPHHPRTARSAGWSACRGDDARRHPRLRRGVVASVAAATTKAPKANAARTGCNGYFELCAQPFDQIVWPASHNAMSSSAYNFLGAEHTITIPEQLIGGARFLMLDVYYGYDDNGLVRTNLAGGVDRKQLEKERGKAAVDSLQRIGALTGTADTSGHKQELYFCHDLCELGAVKAVDVFREIDDYLDRNLTDFVVLDFEDYVQPKDLQGRAAGVGPLRPRPDDDPGGDPRRAARLPADAEEGAAREPAAGPDREREARRRLQVAARRPILLPGDAVHVHERSRTSAARRSGARPATRCSSSTTGCAPNGPPDPAEAGERQLAHGAARPVPQVRARGARCCRTCSRSTSPRSARCTRRSASSTARSRSHRDDVRDRPGDQERVRQRRS